MRNVLLHIILPLALFLYQENVHAQDNIFVNMGALDGIDITPGNLLSFQVLSQLDRNTRTLVEGTIRYRHSDLRITYRFECTLHPGINTFPSGMVHPRMQYSSTALRELFEQYQKLPQGIYEYCVTVRYDYRMTERAPGEPVDECIYHKSEDIFLINLVDPGNEEKIYEYNPTLSWTVNYPFAAALQYRLRIAAIKKGQNAVAAITRNNPVFDEKNLTQMSLVYPVYAKPLQKFQPYAWTVDAYYKGVLLGGAEPWIFTIIEDSLLKSVAHNQSYVDIRKETGGHNLYAEGVLKLKYYLDDLRTDSLSLQLFDKKQKLIKLKESTVLHAVYGDNRFLLDFKHNQPLKHKQFYTLVLQSQTGRVYRVLFQYINPELIR